jgi:ribosomal-protein-alanine N-acetyltransferase
LKVHGDYQQLTELTVMAGCADASLVGVGNQLNPCSLSTGRLILQPVTLNDCDEVFDIYAREQVIRYFAQDRMTDVAQARFWIEVQLRMQQLGLAIAWCLRLKDGGRVIGTICLDGINHQRHNASISYGLHPDYWRRGLMREALAAVGELAFSAALGCRLHRIQALVFAENQPSVALLQQLGFMHEGRRLGLLFWQQRYWDLESYCWLNPDAAASPQVSPAL